MAISGYSIGGYWWLLIGITLVVIGGYFSNGYWWLFHCKPLVVILLAILCYTTTIGDYYIINYCLIFYVIVS